MSDQLGNTRFAAELYWPGDGVVDLVGVDPSRLVHPELVHRAPDAVHWSGARTSANAVLADVAAHIAELAARGTPASETVLFWLDEGLAAGTLEAAGVRDALSNLRMFADDLGRLRHSDELVIEGARRLFGARRGDWAPGARATRLASALRIPRRPGKREVLAFVDQILRELTTVANVARDDSELIQLLPRCLDVLVEEGGRGPALLPVVCRDEQGAVLAVLPHAADRMGCADDDDDRELIVV